MRPCFPAPPPQKNPAMLKKQIRTKKLNLFHIDAICFSRLKWRKYLGINLIRIFLCFILVTEMVTDTHMAHCFPQSIEFNPTEHVTSFGWTYWKMKLWLFGQRWGTQRPRGRKKLLWTLLVFGVRESTVHSSRADKGDFWSMGDSGAAPDHQTPDAPFALGVPAGKQMSCCELHCRHSGIKVAVEFPILTGPSGTLLMYCGCHWGQAHLLMCLRGGVRPKSLPCPENDCCICPCLLMLLTDHLSLATLHDLTSQADE